jgi:hypothetical protein
LWFVGGGDDHAVDVLGFEESGEGVSVGAAGLYAGVDWDAFGGGALFDGLE